MVISCTGLIPEEFQSSFLGTANNIWKFNNIENMLFNVIVDWLNSIQIQYITHTMLYLNQ